MNKDINFEYIEDFADYIVDEVENDEDLFLTIIGKFNEIKEIIKEMLVVAEVDFENIHLESPDVSGYEDEYVLDCYYDNGIMQIGCEPANRDGKYLNLCGDETYILDNCSSKIIPLCEGSDLYFVNIEDECDCNEECDECYPCDCRCGDSCVEYSKTDDGELHGFTASKSTGDGYHSYSFYTSDNLSKSDIHDMLKEFGFYCWRNPARTSTNGVDALTSLIYCETE